MAHHKQNTADYNTNDDHSNQSPNSFMDKLSTQERRTPYMSNLGNLIKNFPKYIQLGIEHIATHIWPPWWELKATTEISPLNKEKAAQAHEQRLRQTSRQDLIIYTDGSGHDGHIGAAIYSPTLKITKGEYIGTEDTHNVYAAELTAIQMAVSLFEEQIEKYKNI